MEYSHYATSSCQTLAQSPVCLELNRTQYLVDGDFGAEETELQITFISNNVELLTLE